MTCPVGHPPNRREPTLPCRKCAANERRRARRAIARGGYDIQDDPRPRMTGRSPRAGRLHREVGGVSDDPQRRQAEAVWAVVSASMSGDRPATARMLRLVVLTAAQSPEPERIVSAILDQIKDALDRLSPIFPRDVEKAVALILEEVERAYR